MVFILWIDAVVVVIVIICADYFVGILVQWHWITFQRHRLQSFQLFGTAATPLQATRSNCRKTIMDLRGFYRWHYVYGCVCVATNSRITSNFFFFDQWNRTRSSTKRSLEKKTQHQIISLHFSTQPYSVWSFSPAPVWVFCMLRLWWNWLNAYKNKNYFSTSSFTTEVYGRRVNTRALFSIWINERHLIELFNEQNNCYHDMFVSIIAQLHKLKNDWRYINRSLK